MSKPIPTVQKYMSSCPVTIAAEQPMVQAHRLMREHHIRHLPVLQGDKIVGILSDGDLHLIETLSDVHPEKVSVAEAMTSNPYCVTPSSPLDEVVATMAEKKYGCAVVVDNHQAVGILTTVDVCRAFAELLHTRLAK